MHLWPAFFSLCQAGHAALKKAVLDFTVPSLIPWHKVWEEQSRPFVYEDLLSLSHVCTDLVLSSASWWMPAPLLPAQINCKSSDFSSSAGTCSLLEASALFHHAKQWGFTWLVLVKDEQAPFATEYSSLHPLHQPEHNSWAEGLGYWQLDLIRSLKCSGLPQASSPWSRVSWMSGYRLSYDFDPCQGWIPDGHFPSVGLQACFTQHWWGVNDAKISAKVHRHAG